MAPVAPETIAAPTDVIPLGPVAPEKPPEIKKTETPPPEVAPPPVKPVEPAPSRNRPNPDAALNRRLKELERKVAAAELDEAIEARIGNIAASRGRGSGEASESAGSSRGQALDPEKERYYRHIRDIVGSNWVAPSEALSSDISADYQVRIETDGRVSASRLLRSSGNPEFDLSVERAVAKSSPFPPLPEVFEGRPDDPALRFHLTELLR
jgi:colicin import membrane protein